MLQLQSGQIDPESLHRVENGGQARGRGRVALVKTPVEINFEDLPNGGFRTMIYYNLARAKAQKAAQMGWRVAGS